MQELLLLLSGFGLEIKWKWGPEMKVLLFYIPNSVVQTPIIVVKITSSNLAHGQNVSKESV